MKICGIVCELNPLHAGHLRLLRAARERAETVVLCMSGNFTQRGEPAAADKFTRARWAVEAGADLVLELPTPFVLSSAEGFCGGGVAVLRAFGADGLAFGSECGSLPLLREAAGRLDLPETAERLRQALDGGAPYHRARGGGGVLESPNNLLGAEYLRAISRLGADMEVFTVRREGVHDGRDPESGSASSVRLAHREGRLEDVSAFVPKGVLDDLRDLPPWSEQTLFALLRFVFRTRPEEELAALHNMGEGLHRRFIRAAAEAESTEDFFRRVKTKRYPLSRIRRAAMCALLGLRQEEVRAAATLPPPLKVLAVSADRKDLLAVSGLLINAADGRACKHPAVRADERAAAVYGLLFPGRGPAARDMISPPILPAGSNTGDLS